MNATSPLTSQPSPRGAGSSLIHEASQMPRETIDALENAGFFKMLQPEA
jgi:hypothetical protein